jgi:hypothetical protein
MRQLRFLITDIAQKNNLQEANNLGTGNVSGKGAIQLEKSEKFCHFFNNRRFCKATEKNCRYKHEKSPLCEQATNCTTWVCQFTHNKNWRPQKTHNVRSTNTVTVPERSQKDNNARSTNMGAIPDIASIQETPQEAINLSAGVVTGPQEVTSWGAWVATEEVTVPTKKELNNKTFCHFFNNGRSCKFSKKGCKYQHEDSPRCEQDQVCTNQVCQFTHSRKWKPQKSRRSSSREVSEEGAVILEKSEKYCHFFINQRSCKYDKKNCKYRHEESPLCYRAADCTNWVCQYQHSQD